MPDYELVEWNMSNVVLDSDYARWCADRSQWAFLSDYVKARVLYERGGIFLDTDVVARRGFNSFLGQRAFSGFERIGLPFTAVWGSEVEHPWPAAALDYLHALDVARILDEPNTAWMTRLLVDRFHIDRFCDSYQEGAEGVTIYPSETLCLGNHVGWASHLFAGSWLQEGLRGTYRREVDEEQEAQMLVEAQMPDVIVDLGRLMRFRETNRFAALDDAEREARFASGEEFVPRWELLADVEPAQAWRIVTRLSRRIGRLYLSCARSYLRRLRKEHLPTRLNGN